MTMTASKPTNLRTLKGQTVTVNGIGFVDGYLQLALVGVPEESLQTIFLYQMKCDGDLCSYLAKTWDCWANSIYK